MPSKLEDPRRIQEKYEDDFNNGGKQLHDAEIGDTSAYAGAGIDQAEAYLRNAAEGGDGGDVVRDKEQTRGAWNDNTSTTGTQKVGGWRGFAGKAKVLIQKKGAVGIIIALLGGGAFVPFLGAASLPFSIIGNMDAKSMILGLNQYSQDYYGFKVFGGDQSSVKKGTSAKLAGLSKSEIAQLEKNGVSFKGGKTNALTKKTTYTAVRVGNGEWVDAKGFNKELRTNVIFRKSMIFNKGSLWKTSKSAVSTKLRQLLRLTTNPDLDGKTTADKDKKLLTEAVEGTDGSLKGGNVEDTDKDGNTKNAGKNAEADGLAGSVNEIIDEQKIDIDAGNVTADMAENSNMGNIGTQLSRAGADITEASGIGAKVWNFVNVLGPLDTICTAYQTAYTANMIARTIALVNIMRFANTVRVAIERAKAGDDDGESVKYLMEMIQQKDPATGQSFDSTSYAAFLFTGKLSAEPSAVSAFGGQAMVALTMGMTALHAVAGGGNPIQGRINVRDTCKIATNLGAQIGATVVAAIGTFFTGGAAGGAIAAAKASFSVGLKVAVKKITEQITEKFGKAALKKLLENEAGKITAGSVSKFFARNAWRGFKSMWGGMTLFDKVGLLVVGVSAFGVGYIASALSGASVAGLTKNGPAAFDGIGTGEEHQDYLQGMGNGGTIGTYATSAQYEATKNSYEQQYLADAKYDASSTPLDLTTPYSTLGAAVLGAQKMIGISASLDMVSTLRAVAMLPLKIPLLSTASAAEDEPTPQAIAAKIGNPYMETNEISLTVTGSPRVVFNKTYTFQEFLDNFVDNDKPQVTYDGDDEASGDPKFSIISGSDLDIYNQKCHDPTKAELDPEYSDYTDPETGASYTLKDACIDNANPEFDDALRFISQVSADAPQSSAVSGAATTGDGQKIGDYTKGSFYQCAAWIGQRVLPDIYGIPNPHGNGNQIAPNLGKMGYKVDNTPAVHSIVSFPANCSGCGHGSTSAGHVAVVYAVNSDGSIEIEDYNGSGKETYTTSHVEASVVPRLLYAHVEGEFGKGPKAIEVLGPQSVL